MHDLTNLVEQVLTKVRFNVRTVRRVNPTKVGGVFESVEFEIHTESKTSLTAAGLRRHYRSSKRAWGTSSEVGVAYVGDGRETMDALTNELRSLMRPFVESTKDIVGHGLCSIRSTGRISLKTYPSQLVGLETFSKVSDVAEALVVAGGCIGSESATRMLLQWLAGEPLRYRTYVLLPYATTKQRLQSDGVSIEQLPASVTQLPSSLPESGSININEFLRGAVMSVETCASPAFFRPDAVEHHAHKVQPICVLGDEPVVMERFCESLSLAADDHIRHKWMWPDYGTVTAFGFGKPGTLNGPSEAGYNWPKVQLSRRILNHALKIHRMRNRRRKETRGLETSISRWVKSKDITPGPGWEDRFIELRIALEALYLDNDQGELSFRLATNAAWDLGATPSQRHSYHELLREAYRLSSRAIHGRIVSPTEPNRKLLWQAQAACRKGILKRLEHPAPPDWLRLVLGHKNTTPKA